MMEGVAQDDSVWCVDPTCEAPRRGGSDVDGVCNNFAIGLPRNPRGSQDSIVDVVEDDVRVRKALPELITSLNRSFATFGSVAKYLAYAKRDPPVCLILDIKLPDINGLNFQRQRGDSYHPPIVFITGHGDNPPSVRAIKAGAVYFLPKPFSQPDLMTAIEAAITRD